MSTLWEYDNFIVDVEDAILYIDKNKVLTKKTNYRNIVKQHYTNMLLHEIQNRTITILDYLPTYQCLGNCIYCYNKNINNILDDDLTIEQIQQTILNLQQHMSVQPKMSRVYGGEPFLSKNIFNIREYLYNTYDLFTYISSGMLFTNDYFYTNVLDKLLSLSNLRKIGIGVSCDIDCNTRYNNLNLTWNQIYDRAKILSDYNFGHIVINTVLTKESNLNNIFNIILSNINKYNIYYRITIASSNLNMSVSESQLEQIYNFFITNISNRYLLIDNMPIDYFENFTLTKLEDNVYALLTYPKYCGLFSSMITINPTGKLIHCHMNPKDMCIDVENFQDKELFFQGSIKCNNCSLFLLCRGNCFYRVNKYENHNIYCKWLEYKYKIMFAKMNDSFLKQNKGLFI